MLKKLGTLLLSAILILSTASVARAQTRFYDLAPLEQIKQNEAPTLDPTTVTAGRFNAFVNNQTIGWLSTHMVSYNKSAAVSQIGSAIAMMAGNPPVQIKEYLAYMGQKAGFVDQAYAQAGGFEVLKPVQQIWVATRNVAYLITSLTLVVIGFMIMMRKKLDAQTVIGIQQALPSIVITLLLITFSYAIAGLVVDLIYFVIYFVIQLLGTNIFTDPAIAIKTLRERSIFTIGLQDLFKLGGGSADDSAAKAIGDLIDSIFTEGTGAFISGAISTVVGGSIGSLIIAGAMLFAAVKIFFALLSSYAMLLLSTMFGPLMLMTNAVPGSNAFGTWIKNLLGNAAVFPATAIFLVLAAALMGGDVNAANWGLKTDVGFGSVAPGEVAWTPPLLFGTGAGSNPSKALLALIGLGMFMLTPQFIEMVKKAFSAAGGEGYGSAIGQALQYGYKGQYSPMGAMTGGRGLVGGLTGLGMGGYRATVGYGRGAEAARGGLELEARMRHGEGQIPDTVQRGIDAQIEKQYPTKGLGGLLGRGKQFLGGK